LMPILALTLLAGCDLFGSGVGGESPRRRPTTSASVTDPGTGKSGDGNPAAGEIKGEVEASVDGPFLPEPKVEVLP